MSKSLIVVVVILLSGLLLTAGVELYDRERYDKVTLNKLSEQLANPAYQLETSLKSIIEVNEFFARLLNDNPNINTRMLASFAEEWINKNPLVTSVSSSKEYLVDFVYPLRGNERLINLDYRLRPEHIEAIQLAMVTNNTVVEAPIRLLQNGRVGVIISSPYKLSSVQSLRGSSWGVTSMTLDLNSLLNETGFLNPALDFNITVRKLHDSHQFVDIVGNSRNLGRLYVSQTIDLPNGQWELLASEKVISSYSVFRIGLIRSIGIIMTLTAIFVLLRYLSRPSLLKNGDSNYVSDNTFTFKSIIRLCLIIPFTLIIVMSNIFSYKASMKSAEQLKQAQIFEISAQLHEKVKEFFTIPSRILIFNAEQFRLGLIDLDRPDQMLQSFHLQLRQHPLLTFLSVGTVKGEYFAASQPPRGEDRAVRIIDATIANDRIIRIYQADDLGQRSELSSVGNEYFDARTRPWFRSAIASDTVQWYPIYRYLIKDLEGIYDTLGFGMAAVIRGLEQEPIGVITADVALSQIDEFLASYMARLNGIAFIAEKPSLEFIASSAAEPTFFFSGNQTLRVTISESSNPVIRHIGNMIETAESNFGTEFININNVRYLIDWQIIHLPNGPQFTLGIALPESHLVSPARSVLLTNVILTLFLWGVMLITTLLLTRWFANPMHSLNDWLAGIMSGDWNVKPPIASRFKELEDIRLSTGLMAQSFKRTIDTLEVSLKEKTKLLDDTEQQLKEMSTSDPVTGMANKHYFERFFSQEWSRAERSRQSMAIMLLELDDFDLYLDLFGDLDGVEALQQIAKVLNDSLMSSIDLVAHLGVGQFAIITPSTESENAMILAENILRGIEYQGIVHPKSESGVFTACVGVGVYQGRSDITPVTFIESIEDALKQAKAEGKNRVVLADDVAH